MRIPVRLACLAAGLLICLPQAAAAATTPGPPTVTGLCSTANDYFWTIASTDSSLSSYDVEYRASFADWLPATLSTIEDGTRSTIVATSHDAGTTLSARWAAYPDVVGTSSAPSSSPCEKASLTVTIVVEGGASAAGAFDVTVTGAESNPPWGTRAVVHAVSGTAIPLDAGAYIVTPQRSGLPPGYFWRSTMCQEGATDDPAYPRLIVHLAPGAGETCPVVYHYGPILADAIAAGKNSGTDGFGSSPLLVPSGTFVTYLVRTQPNLAGRSIQVWRRVGSGTWALAGTRTVAADGTVHYYAKISAATSFQARWPGDETYPASSAAGRRATPSTKGEARLAVTCDEFLRATGDDGTATIHREVWVKSGAKITATLCENATTGFRWGSPTYNHGLVSLVGHRSVGAGSGAVGAPGTAAWTFKALKAGTSTITLEYSRPWTGGDQRVWTFELIVHASR